MIHDFILNFLLAGVKVGVKKYGAMREAGEKEFDLFVDAYVDLLEPRIQA